MKLNIQPAIANATDPAILFPANASRKAAFQIGNSDVASFAGHAALKFKTGATAGALTFTVKLGGYTKQTSVVIAPAPVGIYSAKAAHTSTGIEVSITASDNTRSASQSRSHFTTGTASRLALALSA